MIFYFSATGNTLWAAQKISQATGESLIEITPQADTSYTLGPDERIGFCFPVHGWRPPSIVRRFVSNLHISGAEGHYTFALCSAGDTIGETLDIFARDLAQSTGIKLNAKASIIMPESYIGLPFMDVDTPDNEQRKINRAAERLTSIAEDIKQRRAIGEKLDIGHWPRINSRVIGAAFVGFIITDKPFHVEADRCLKCGKCATVCPVDDIIGGKGCMPEWKHNDLCMSCFKCYHHCPTHAIEYGNRTRHKGQYYFGRRKPNTLSPDDNTKTTENK